MLSSLLTITPRDHQPLTLRRGRALALLMILFLSMTSLASIISWISGDSILSIGILIGITVASLLIYGVNRAGHIQLAIQLFLCWLAALPWVFVVLLKTPIPPVYFFNMVVVAAAVFSRPRTPLLWAAGLTLMPPLFNLYLYASPLPPMAPPILPGGYFLPPILIMEVNGIILLWIVAGGAAIATRLLHQALGESEQAARSWQEAQDALLAQQADLARRNEELDLAREELVGLVRELAVPVVPIDEGIGLLPLMGALTQERMREIEQRTLGTAASQRLRALVIDLSGAHGLEETGSDALIRLCAGLRLLGVEPLLTGIRPQQAMLLSGQGIQLPSTAATLRDALVKLRLAAL